MNDPAPQTASADLRLRAPHVPVVRLSRKVLIGGASLLAIGLCVTVGVALVHHRKTEAPPELYNVATGPPERLASLPADYAAVPRLGPPLPGDLGRPILSAGKLAPVYGPPTQSAPAMDEDGARATRQHLQQEREAALTGRLFVARGSSPSPIPALPAQALDILAQTTPASLPAGGLSGQGVSSAQLEPPPSPYVLQAGAVIPAALVTGVQSDLPGQVVGQVTQPVFDSPTGQVLLIPQGARLVGVYESRIAFGQRRVMLAWTRLIFPDGRSLALEQLPAADLAGRTGLTDGVDRHWSGLFGMAALSTLLGMGAELGAGDDNGIVQALRSGAVGTFNQVGQQAVGRGLSVPPTLTLRPGAPARVIVTRDLVLQPYRL